MERDAKYLEYRKLIDRYSKAYYARVKDLFDLEDIAQEMWMALLKAEQGGKYKALNDSSKLTFLSHCIRNAFNNLLVREIQKKRTLTDSLDTVDEEIENELPNPEEIMETKEQVKSIQLQISHIRHGEFIFDHMDMSVRKLSKLAASQGINLPRSTVQYKKKVIKSIMMKEIVGQNE